MYRKMTNEQKEILSLFISNRLNLGRTLTRSISRYKTQHPDNLIVFNANVILENGDKVWYGDLDVSLDKHILKEVSRRCGKTLYVLEELDARYGRENRKSTKLKSKAVWNTSME